MSRQFPDTSGITLAVGSAGVLDGAWSFATIVKQTTRSTQSLISQQASTHNRGGLWTTSAGLLQASSGAGNSATFGITLPLGVWVLVAITKSAGDVTPRGHMYRYDTAAWVHAAGNGTLANDTTPITHVELGRSFSDWYYIGLMANAGVWDRALSDVEVEGLELTLQAWVDATPAALWPLNQTSVADPVQDIIGAADQTSTSGTSVSADEPAGWSYTLDGGGVSGTISATLPALTGSLSGAATVDGNLSGALPALTGSATGAVTASGTLTGTLPALTGALSGSVADNTVRGAISATLPAFTGDLTGTLAATGTVAATLPALAGALSGRATVSGSLSGTFPALTGSLIEGRAIISRPNTGTITRPDTGIVIHLLTVVVRLYTGIISRP